MRVSALFGVALAALLACERGDANPAALTSTSMVTDFAPLPLVPEGYEFATLAGGCFWCLEADLEKVPGVLFAVSGYTGGHKARPTYEETGTKKTGHAEAVRVVYDPKRLSYAKLLEFFWRHIDPTDAEGQFCDRGDVYRPEIFVHDAEQRRIAEASRRTLEATRPFTAPVRVPITDAGVFWTAENYHQDYAQRNPVRYRTYRMGCGRDRRLDALWRPAEKVVRP
ncbi:MAG: peptide-methionine (S)-S-oxide reductase MsrA [Myxococcota bacterium]